MHEFLSISFTHHIAILTKAKTYKDFLATIPDYKKVYRAIRMFKDVYLLDFINVEELGMHDKDINESVIESNIVHNVKNYIMTFGRGWRLCRTNMSLRTALILVRLQSC